ncbi:MAG TPA: hypothetical protein VLX11_15335 [Candidatus Acidoferrales bacterium]|nr:hypothetical protein [Candidatus Acidoferrales bacterium]
MQKQPRIGFNSKTEQNQREAAQESFLRGVFRFAPNHLQFRLLFVVPHEVQGTLHPNSADDAYNKADSLYIHAVCLLYEESRSLRAFVLVRLLLFRQMGKLSPMLFPMLPVESRNRNFLDCARIQATQVNTVAVGIRPRYVKRLDAAYFAKQVLRDAGVECVRGKAFAPLQQDKPRLGNDKVKIHALGANGTIAFGGLDFIRRFDLKSNPPTVATPRMDHGPSSYNVLQKILTYPSDGAKSFFFVPTSRQ